MYYITNLLRIELQKYCQKKIFLMLITKWSIFKPHEQYFYCYMDSSLLQVWLDELDAAELLNMEQFVIFYDYMDSMKINVYKKILNRTLKFYI